MNKKLLALAVAAALAPAAAMADSGNVTIYGVATVSYDNVSTGATGADTLNRISSNNSFIGFKGSESLGNGMSAIWQMEQTVNMDNGAATTGGMFSGAQRNTFVGLSSKTAGTVLAGTHDTPYKLGTGKLDVFADSLGDYNNIVGNVNGANVRDLRLGNVLAYVSPTFSGFHAAVATSMLQETSNGALNNAKAWTATGIYENGPLFASLSWEKQTVSDTAAGAAVNGTYACVDTAGIIVPVNVSAASGAAALTACQVIAAGYDYVIIIAAPTAATAAVSSYDTKGTKLGLGYNFGQGTKVGMVYERLTDSRADQAGTRNAYLLNAAHTMGANTVKLQYGKAKDGASTANTAASNWTLGVDHAMSKRTNVYALYTSMRNDDGATYGVGVASGAYATTIAGDDPHAVSVGVKHSF